MKTLTVAPLAEAAILTRRELFDDLAENPYITAETWRALYTAKPLPPVDRAIELLNRPLSDYQVEWVCANETRSSVMHLVLAYHEVSPNALSRLASGKGLSQATARQLIEADWVSDAVKEQVARKAGGNALVRWLSSSDLAQCSTEAGEAIIADVALWGKSKVISHQLMHSVVDRRPDLYRSIIEAGLGHPLFGQVLGSRHLTDPELAKVVTAQIKAVAQKCRALIEAAESNEVPDLAQMKRVGPPWRLLRGCEQLTATLIANPAVAPEQVVAANVMFTALMRPHVATWVANAYATRQQVHKDGYDPMSGAIVEPYDSLSDESVLAYLLDNLERLGGLAMADLARSPIWASTPKRWQRELLGACTG